MKNKFIPDNALIESGFFDPIDTTFADFIIRLEGTDDQLLWIASALVSRAAREKDVCLNLSHPARLYGDDELALTQIKFPTADEFAGSLRGKKTVGAPGETAPLVLDGTRLYLSRYYHYETVIAREIKNRGDQKIEIDRAFVGQYIDKLFPEQGGAVNWQRAACINALSRRLTVITGGPGTGKTTTVVRALLLIAFGELMRSGALPSIALAAPTGKAAAHMHRSVKSAVDQLGVTAQNDPLLAKLLDAAKDAFPETGVTLHRLLGSSRGQYAKADLLYDIVVIDECSMADSALFAAVLERLGGKTRVILLGDQDQLSSVEAGSVLGDICEQPGGKRLYSRDYAESVKNISTAALAENQITDRKALYGVITYLTESRRFDSSSGIGRLAKLINEGKGAEALELIQSGTYKDLLWTELPKIPSRSDYTHYAPVVEIVEDALTGFAPEYGSPWFDRSFLSTDNPDTLMKQLGRFQVLCATRRGAFGSTAMNAMIESILDAKDLVRARGVVYHGMPLIVTENDHPLRIYNGDAGMICSTPDGLRAVFLSGDARVRSIIPLQISSWEKGYAITVHKSQGSEYDHIVIMLGDRMSRVLTRELLYTAVTRARKSVRIVGRSEHFIEACSRRTERESGLSERLWG